MTDEEMTALATQIEEQINSENKNFILRDFDEETMEKFLLWADTAGDYKVIYLNTPGGHMHVCDVITDKINEDPEKYHIKMFGSVISAGMYLIMNSKCTVEDITESIDDYTLYLYHNAYIDFTSRPKRHAREHYLRLLEERNKKAYLRIKDHFTMEQNQQMEKFFKDHKHPIKKFFVNDDIYLDLWQIKRIVGDRYVSS